MNFYATAQQPGGVGGPRLWYVTEKMGNTFSLKDISGYKYDSYGGGTGRTGRNINFHPALTD